MILLFVVFIDILVGLVVALRWVGSLFPILTEPDEGGTESDWTPPLFPHDDNWGVPPDDDYDSALARLVAESFAHQRG